jgi:hypothetical protein
MDESELDDLLRRYRPTGPPPDLEASVIGRSQDRRAWPWAVAAAALLFATVAFHAATPRIVAGDPASAQWEDAVRETAAALGGDGEALDAARLIVTEQQRRASLEREADTEGPLNEPD